MNQKLLQKLLSSPTLDHAGFERRKPQAAQQRRQKPTEKQQIQQKWCMFASLTPNSIGSCWCFFFVGCSVVQTRPVSGVFSDYCSFSAKKLHVAKKKDSEKTKTIYIYISNIQHEFFWWPPSIHMFKHPEKNQLDFFKSTNGISK